MRFSIAAFKGAQRQRLILWAPVMLMLGIGGYFVLNQEPVWWAGLLLLATSLVLARLVYDTRFRFAALAFMLVCLGFSAGQWRSHQMLAPLLTQEFHNRIVEGTIDEIEPVEKKEKLVLSRLRIENVAEDQIPRRVRISFRGQNPQLRVGDRVRFRANVYPLPSQVMPGSYDFARHFYFRNIGGNGYAMGSAQIIAPAQQSNLSNWLNNLRHAIGEDMRTQIPSASGTVAAAMTVGEMGPIPADVQAVLRDSGLSHMLSISGLHLSIVTGFIFYCLRLLLTLYTPMALRLPIKKIACVLALAGAFFYLMLAGMSIPAQRSFITVSFVFLAILLDRRGITLRTLAISAIILLLLFPESMLGPSFQMSFAATLAIVSLYEGFGAALYSPSAAFGTRLWRHLVGIVLTSLVATLATAPFVLYHFNRFALFSILSNMMVVPLATFIIMPALVIAVLLMPFGLQWLAYVPLAWGVDWMIATARWVTALPYASINLPAPSDAGLLLCVLGLLLLCLIKGRVRFIGIIVGVAGLATISQHVPIDVLVGEDGRQIMVRLDSGQYTALKGTMRSFTIQNWLRSQGEEDLVPVKDSGIDCDKSLCTYFHGGYRLKIVRKPHDEAALYAACTQPSDMVIAWRIINATNCPKAGTLIGRNELEKDGAHAIWLDTEGIRIQHTRQNLRHRIWQPVIHSGDDNDDDGL